MALVLEHAAPEAVVVVDAIAIDALGPASIAGEARRGRLLLTPNREELCSLVGDDTTDKADTTTAEAEEADDRRPSPRSATAPPSCRSSASAAADGRVWIDAGEVRGLGTSGAGDVLAGVAGGLAARCGDAAQAACWAAVTHRRAAQRLSRSVAPIGYLARQLADEVAPALAELTG